MHEDEEIEDRKFDFDTMVRDARLGYTELRARRTSVRDTIDRLLDEEKLIVEQCDKLSKMLSSMGIEPEETISRPRQSNIATVAAEVIEETFRKFPALIAIDESELIKAVAVRLPFAKEKSIQGAFYRLTQTNPKITRRGKRGSYQYTFSDVEVSAPVFIPPTHNWMDPEMGGGKMVDEVYVHPRAVNPADGSPPADDSPPLS